MSRIFFLSIANWYMGSITGNFEKKYQSEVKEFLPFVLSKIYENRQGVRYSCWYLLLESYATLLFSDT
jgi:hypothetical protein